MSDRSLPDGSTPIFDTHAHLDELADQLDVVIDRAAAAGVTHIMAIGTTLASSREVVDIAHRYHAVSAAVGLQPNYVAQSEAADWDAIVKLSRDDAVAAIGETGLDRYWDYTPFEQQQDYFHRHLELSRQSDRPIVIHMRDCLDDVLKMLEDARQRGPIRGIMHSYTGDEAGMWACVELGLHISFAGMVTFKKSNALRDVARAVPADRLLIETDSPYLSPHPKRSVRPNEPALLVHTATCIADVRGVSLSDLATLTTRNAQNLLGIKI